MTFKEKFNEYLNIINEELDTLFPYADIPEKRIYEAVRYSLSAGGKRIRPIIALGFCEMLLASAFESFWILIAIATS